ncbi:MAG: hypothetical protein R3B96_15195 [Pirellulaceae bacterium]
MSSRESPTLKQLKQRLEAHRTGRPPPPNELFDGVSETPRSSIGPALPEIPLGHGQLIKIGRRTRRLHFTLAFLNRIDARFRAKHPVASLLSVTLGRVPQTVPPSTRVPIWCSQLLLWCRACRGCDRREPSTMRRVATSFVKLKNPLLAGLLN